MMKYDRSPVTVVISCTECPHWRAIRFDQWEAYLSGESHAIRVHGVEPVRAAEARRLWEKRHAVKP